jgi:hypothetical protein
LYKSKTKCWPFSVGSFIEVTSTFPKLDWIKDAVKLQKIIIKMHFSKNFI